MNDDQLDDLKQFIDSRISQSEDKITSETRSSIQELRQEMLDGFAGVGDAIEEIHKRLDETKAEFDARLTKLEQQAT